MYILENEKLRITVKLAGGELTSLFNKESGIDYMWSGDSKFWAKQSPVLFPIVGTLKDDRYLWEDKEYELSRHGFAREKIFEVVEQSPVSLSLEIRDNETTLPVFPFQFGFVIKYALEEDRLSVTYRVKNNGAEQMYFSVGGHPAFKLPLAEDLAYNDYYLLFNRVENAGRWPISKEGLIESSPLPLLNNTNRLNLSKSLFYGDAIVFKELVSDEVKIQSDHHSAGFSFSFKGFPFLGVWAAKDANFICIEPWCGIADSVNTSQQIKEKEGIIDLAAGAVFERTWSVTTW